MSRRMFPEHYPYDSRFTMNGHPPCADMYYNGQYVMPPVSYSTACIPNNIPHCSTQYCTQPCPQTCPAPQVCSVNNSTTSI